MCGKIPCEEYSPEQKKSVEEFEKLIGRKLVVPTNPESSEFDDGFPYCCVRCGEIYLKTWGMCEECSNGD